MSVAISPLPGQARGVIQDLSNGTLTRTSTAPPLINSGRGLDTVVIASRSKPDVTCTGLAAAGPTTKPDNVARIAVVISIRRIIVV